MHSIFKADLMIPSILRRLFFCSFMILCVSSFAQVGINTENPRTTLEVAGSAKTTALKVNEIPKLQNGQASTFLIQDSEGAIKTMDPAIAGSTSLAYVAVYELYNPNGDWVLNFDTKIATVNYDVVAISAFYDKELSADRNDFFSIPYTAAFAQNGTWRLIADYPSIGNRNANDKGTWTITVIIYSKTLSKNIGNKTFDLNGSATGNSGTAIIN